ncbi:MAG: ttgC [Acidobacteria bacterium]|nr:ttgC [Acidobacteriota bacterium]
MRLYQLFRARNAVIAAVLVLPAVSASGQQVSATGQGQPASLSLALRTAAQNVALQPDETLRRISIDEAVNLAMEQNLGIRIQRFDPQIQDTGVSLARSLWQPNFQTTLTRQSQTQAATSALAGGSTVDNGTFASNVGLNQALPWGGSYTANWNSSRLTTTNLFSNFSPQLTSNLNVQYTQPLLRNFQIDSIRQQVAVSKKVRDLSDIQLESVVTQTLRNVRNAYWDLSYSINNLKAQQESLALSRQSLKDNQKRVEIGTMAPIDIVQAQAEVATNESSVIVAEAAIKQAQDALRALILDPGTPQFWTMVFEPSDLPSFDARAIDLDAAVRNALDKRADVRAAKNALDQSDINIKYYGNQLKPDVNANIGYNPIGVGGTQLSAVDLQAIAAGASPNRTVINNFGFGGVLGDLFQGVNPTWTFGVTVGYPLGANTAHANLARVKLEYDQAQAQLKNMEMQVITQVRTAARNVLSNQQLVQSARASRELQEKKLEAEEKKLAAGMSSPFFVVQAQRDLSLARTVEIRAISDYNKSLVDFEAVQQVPINGGGNFVQVAR